MEVAIWSSLVILTSVVFGRVVGVEACLIKLSTGKELEKTSMDRSFEVLSLQRGAENWGNY